MGYRAEWLKHEGLLSVHSEEMLHAVDRAVRDGRHDLLLLGVDNGGKIEVWRRVLSEESTITAIDVNPAVADLNLDVLIGDVTDGDWLRHVLRGRKFDVVIDSTGTHSPVVWPFIHPGGVLIYEGYDKSKMLSLASDVCDDTDSWLPFEEIMSLVVFQKILVVEKRNPRVVPYLDVIVGKSDPIISEDLYKRKGAKRVTTGP